MTSLDTGVKIVRNVGRFTIGDGSISGVADLVNAQRTKVSPNLDESTLSAIGRICVKQDKQTKQLMIWREEL